MNNILFFLTPKAMCAYLYDDYTIRQALEKMEAAHYSALPILNRRGEYRGTLLEQGNTTISCARRRPTGSWRSPGARTMCR